MLVQSFQSWSLTWRKITQFNTKIVINLAWLAKRALLLDLKIISFFEESWCFSNCLQCLMLEALMTLRFEQQYFPSRIDVTPSAWWTLSPCHVIAQIRHQCLLLFLREKLFSSLRFSSESNPVPSILCIGPQCLQTMRASQELDDRTQLSQLYSTSLCFSTKAFGIGASKDDGLSSLWSWLHAYANQSSKISLPLLFQS